MTEGYSSTMQATRAVCGTLAVRAVADISRATLRGSFSFRFFALASWRGTSKS